MKANPKCASRLLLSGLLAGLLCTALPAAAAEWSWDPLKDAENVLPEGAPNEGMVVNRETGRQTFMKMVQVQGGLGFGVNKNRLVFVFTQEQALRNFIDQGWEFGGQANLSAMADGQGGMFSGAASVAPGVFLYQLTETGLSATLTVSGTKFFKDADLN